MKKIGFIGVGIMGKSMVRNLKKAGFDLHIYARTKAKVEDVIAEGVTFHDSIADCVKDCEAVWDFRRTWKKCISIRGIFWTAQKKARI